MSAAARLLGALLLVGLPSLATAQSCSMQMGSGWPAGMANYGQTAAELLGGAHDLGMSMLILPKRGEESQLVLAPAGEGDWQVIRAVADKRIHHVATDRTGFGVQLRVEQEPNVDVAPIPSDMARRLVGHWTQLMQRLGLDATVPLMDREDVLSIRINGRRFSGRAPSCEAFNRLQDINQMLIELAGSKEKKFEKRYEAIARALDKYEERLATGKI